MSLHKVDSTTGDTSLIAGSMGYADSPIGTILAYGGTTAPAGWFLCQGQELTKTDYADLYAVIGDAFGTASVNTKFVLPDLREATTKGAGLTGKTVGNHLDADGLAVGEFLDDRLQDYFAGGDLPTYIGGESGVVNLGSGNYGFYVGNQKRELKATRRGATTEVKAVGVNYIIKAKMIALPADFMSAVEDAVEDVYGAVIPSDASASNKLVSANSLEAEYTDLTSYLSTGWTVREYVIGYKIGKMVIIDFGGLKSTSDISAGRNQYIMQNLPYSIKNRAVVTLFSDEPENFKKMTVYVVNNLGAIIPDLRASYPSLSASDDNFYGQMIIALD